MAASRRITSPSLPSVRLGTATALLAAVLVLNLGEDERGSRRLRVRPALALPLLALLWIALARPLIDAVPDVIQPAPTSLAVITAVSDDLALPFTIALLALAVALVVAIALVRRRT